MNGMYIRLDNVEKAALSRLSQKERRTMRDQAVMLIRRALIDLGELTEDGKVPHDPRFDGDAMR